MCSMNLEGFADVDAEKERQRRNNSVFSRSDLPELSIKHMDFVHLVAKGMQPSAAYAQVYRGGGEQSNSISSLASQLLRKDKIQAWLQAMREAGCEQGSFTVQNHIAELERLKNLCIENGNYGAAVRAEELRGKCMGLYVERVAHLHTADSGDLLTHVGAMFGEEFKQIAMKKLGLSDKKAINVTDSKQVRDITVTEG